MYITAGARDDRFHDAVLLGARQDQDPRGGREQPEPFDRLHARHAGEPDVHQHDVRAHVDHQPDGVWSVSGLTDELEPVTAQRLCERAADQVLVVNQHDRNRSSLRRRAGRFCRHLDVIP